MANPFQTPEQAHRATMQQFGNRCRALRGEMSIQTVIDTIARYGRASYSRDWYSRVEEGSRKDIALYEVIQLAIGLAGNERPIGEKVDGTVRVVTRDRMIQRRREIYREFREMLFPDKWNGGDL